jgi:hypothetical protein
MPIGTRIGTRFGTRLGAKVGLVGDSPMAGVTQDATSLIYAPSNATEWTTTLSVAGIASGNPASLWLCQDASGNLADAIDTQALAVTGTPLYRQAITGWSRKAVGFSATVGQIWQAGAGVFDASATSVAWLTYMLTPTTPGGARQLVTISSNATSARIDHATTAKIQMTCGANTSSTINTYAIATVYPILLVYDRTHSTFTLYTHLEALSCTFAAVVDASKGFGAVMTACALNARHLYGAVFTGAAAELTTSNARSLLSTLGWSPAF